ncbi:MAG: CTP-dependent riboflavin kinase [Methanobacterium formicicum]|jgi:riboflavin kinase|uniref:Riboflavin kinase n=1 Tax=Methanobacterium formicicum TaxID=2162 RepID=A0A843AJ87_METFO|nr:CTP-dependent riboflavin kinase [Methanobacterium formicicum]MBF4474909.1 CTP-dependent riboflavin kinase [Methanobacterium formicicum]MDD4810394.1 CTP-dependent riboflavin kinase [Methanobacterium formicicum]MDG3546979.1 CTP-dependent riboflavin kinase [Methanobacterium formicicum]
MEIKGKVISGTHKGTYFMSLDVYQDEFREKLKFKPYPGTLNLEISEECAREISKMQDKMGVIEGTDNYGDVKFLPAKLSEVVDGAILFPVRTQHAPEILEFVAQKNLRSKLKLNDGDEVILEIN